MIQWSNLKTTLTSILKTDVDITITTKATMTMGNINFVSTDSHIEVLVNANAIKTKEQMITYITKEVLKYKYPDSKYTKQELKDLYEFITRSI